MSLRDFSRASLIGLTALAMFVSMAFDAEAGRRRDRRSGRTQNCCTPCPACGSSHGTSAPSDMPPATQPEAAPAQPQT
jgi:hypothetical protein